MSRAKVNPEKTKHWEAMDIPPNFKAYYYNPGESCVRAMDAFWPCKPSSHTDKQANGNLHGEAQPYTSGVSFNFLFQVKSGCLLEVKMRAPP